MRTIFLLIGLAFYVPVGYAQEPVSQYYVPEVLERADRGVALGSSGPVASNFIYLFFSWLDDVQTAIVGSIDVENRIVLQESNLTQITPCLHYDLLLIEQKIDQVNKALIEAIAQKRVGDIWLLKELASWINGRYNNLVLGATDPTHVDIPFGWRYSFDTTGWCCQEPRQTTSCSEIHRSDCRNNGGILFKNAEECGQVCVRSNPDQDPAPVCPFDSNYLPPTNEGYGCDAIALEAVNNAVASLLAEKEGLQIFEDRKQDFLQEHADMISVGDDLLRFGGRTPIDLPLWANSPRTHKRVSGCAVDAQNIGRPSGRLPDGAARIALRNPFSFEYQEIRLSTLLEDVLRRLGQTREHENSLKLPSDYPIASAERSQALAQDERLTILERSLRNALRFFFTNTNEEVASKEADPLLRSIDAQQRVEQEFNILRNTSKELGELASKQDRGVRAFAVRFVSFMRRSCAFRPCNKLLEQTSRIVKNNECFPYTNGKYLEDEWSPESCQGEE